MRIFIAGLATLFALTLFVAAKADEASEEAVIVIAQAETTPEPPATETEAAAEPTAGIGDAPSSDEPLADDEELEPSESGTYEDEDDDFIPSQDVSADQSLRFPIDI